jgi:hypothetical protein
MVSRHPLFFLTFLFCFLISAFWFPGPARAQTYYYVDFGGADIVNGGSAVNSTCDGTRPGLIRYNTGNSSFEGCNGAAWGSLALAPTWNAITNPAGNLALTMGANTSTFTYNATTGAGVDLFNLTDTNSNTGTGYLMNLTTGTSSALKPFHVSAAGTEAITVLANGNVGIGTATPGDTLTVNGNLQFSNGIASPPKIYPSAIYPLTISGGAKVCFAAGTKITMADGNTKNIEQIKVGERVESYDFTRHKTVASRVTQVFHHDQKAMGSYYLVIKTKHGHRLDVTTNHPIYVNGAWKEAGELKIGDRLFGLDKHRDAIESIEKINARIPTYNIEVDKYHVYFADALLVHNKGADAPSYGAVYITGGNTAQLGYNGGNVFIYGGTSSSTLVPGNVVLGMTAAAVAQGNVGIGIATPAGKFVVAPPAAETIVAAATITADACGTIKQITAAGAVTTSTTNTFTAPTASYSGCCMDVLNTGANTITLDQNANMKLVGGADLAIAAGNIVRVCSNGTNWYQMHALIAPS